MIELARDVLHLRSLMPAALVKYRQRISFQRCLGEDIDLDEVEALAFRGCARTGDAAAATVVAAMPARKCLRFMMFPPKMFCLAGWSFIPGGRAIRPATRC